MKINLIALITPQLNKLKERYKPQINDLILRLQPLKEYWKQRSEREQQILIIGSIFIVIFIFFSIIGMALDYRNNLRESYHELQRYKIEAEVIAAGNKALANTTPNDFSSVNSDRIKADAAQIMDIKDADIILADNILTVKANNVKFEATMLFLDQLRKSYGLFPSKLVISRLSQSGYVALNVTFTNVEQ